MTTLRALWRRFWRELRIQNRNNRTGPRLSNAAVRNEKRGKR